MLKKGDIVTVFSDRKANLPEGIARLVRKKYPPKSKMSDSRVWLVSFLDRPNKATFRYVMYEDLIMHCKKRSARYALGSCSL